MFIALDAKDLVLKVCSTGWWRVFLWLIDELGARRREAMGLTWGAVDWLRKRVEVAAESSKGRRTRVLPVSEELLAVLKAWREECGKPADGDPVLPSGELDVRRCYDDWHAITAKAGVSGDVKIAPKNFRSNCGSKLIEAGASTLSVKEFLGHASVTTTERYYASAQATLRPVSEARRAMQAKRAAEQEKKATPKDEGAAAADEPGKQAG